MLVKKAFAKINLYLEITGIDHRPDSQGYHLLDSLMAFIDIFDQIKIIPGQQLLLHIDGANSANLDLDPTKNIIIKAINLMASAYNFTPNIDITLTKNIPIGAGLGGGSSDAATIMLMLNELYQLNLSIGQLKALGLKIGCDVPFCLHQKMAQVSGIGEKITDSNLGSEKIWALIINPQKPLATKQVYDLFDQSPLPKLTIPANNNSNLISFIAQRHNVLEAAAIKLMPEIAAIISELKKTALVARMSGSGATCFGLYRDQQQAFQAKINLRQKFPDYYIKKSQLLYNINEEISRSSQN